MSTDASTQTCPDGADAPGTSPDTPGPRQPPHVLIQESIKYRRRAQDAERRAEALEAELATVQGGRDQHAAGLEAQLDQALAEADTLRRHLSDLERDRNLERELVRAGAADTETALALARQRLSGADTPDDLAAFAKALLEEKPHLRGTPRSSAARPAALPPKTSGAKPAGADDPRRAAQRLGDRARTSGRPGDVMAYMRARRGTTV